MSRLALVLKLSALGGIIIFMGGILILPPVGGTSTGLPQFSLSPKPSLNATPVAVASVHISAADSTADPYTITTGSDGFKLVITGFVVSAVSVVLGVYYRKDDEGSSVISPDQTGPQNVDRGNRRSSG